MRLACASRLPTRGPFEVSRDSGLTSASRSRPKNSKRISAKCGKTSRGKIFNARRCCGYPRDCLVPSHTAKKYPKDMRNSSPHLIEKLQNNKRFMGTCPSCDEDFRLAGATLFALDGQPPEAALAAIKATRERIKEQKASLANARERMTTRAQRTAHAVNLGKIVEKIVPSFAEFSYSAGDCRALLEPIDYLMFLGLTNRVEVDALVFLEVKSGKARLTDMQKSIKERVEAGAIKFNRVSESTSAAAIAAG
jgi:predicted Holliday junction resolvase-like endonuclease